MTVRKLSHRCALAVPIADPLRPMPYPDIYRSTAHQTMPHGVAIRSMFSDELSDTALDAALPAMEWISSPYSIVHLRGLGGELARISNDATAFAYRDKRYLTAIIGIWLDAAEDASVHREWVESLWLTIRHEGAGVYVNFLDGEGEDRVHDAYPAANFARLVQIKRKYDPENLSNLNQNIPPLT